MPTIKAKKTANVLTAAADAVGTPRTSATVTVKYVRSGNAGTFSYSGDGGASGDLDMAHGTDTITFTMDSGSTPGWQLDQILFNPSEAFSQAPSGNNIVVTDNNTVTTQTDVCYQVKVKKGTQTDTSPDPKITQEPPATPPGS